MDIHDISRAAKTYGVERFYIVTPLEQQKQFVGKIIDHWQKGYGATYNPWRKKAIDIAVVKSGLSDVLEEIQEETENDKVNIIVTGASLRGKFIQLENLKEKVSENKGAYLLLFGTGWGIADEIINMADYFIEPIRGPSQYNHLSVRSAVSVMLDRLFGKR